MARGIVERISNAFMAPVAFAAGIACIAAAACFIWNLDLIGIPLGQAFLRGAASCFVSAGDSFNVARGKDVDSRSGAGENVAEDQQIFQDEQGYSVVKAKNKSVASEKSTKKKAPDITDSEVLNAQSQAAKAEKKDYKEPPVFGNSYLLSPKEKVVKVLPAAARIAEVDPTPVDVNATTASVAKVTPTLHEIKSPPPTPKASAVDLLTASATADLKGGTPVSPAIALLGTAAVEPPKAIVTSSVPAHISEIKASSVPHSTERPKLFTDPIQIEKISKLIAEKFGWTMNLTADAKPSDPVVVTDSANRPRYTVYPDKLTTEKADPNNFVAMLESYKQTHPDPTVFPKISTDVSSLTMWRDAFVKVYGEQNKDKLTFTEVRPTKPVVTEAKANAPEVDAARTLRRQ